MLIIDTSQKNGVCALYQEGLGFEKIFFDAQNQQKVLIPSIDSLVQGKTLTHIAICIGPGSFTGTRIGVMTGKTLAYAQNLPLIPFNSLIPFHTPNTLTLLDAKHGLCFLFDGHSLEKVPYSSFEKTTLPLFSPYPETIPLPTKQALHSLEKIITLSPATPTLIY